jgi:hypothetical protein
MKGLPSIAKTLEAKVSAVAQRLNKAPATVLEEAVDEYAARHDPEAITDAMNRVADAIDTHPDSGIAGVAERTLRRSEW